MHTLISLDDPGGVKIEEAEYIEVSLDDIDLSSQAQQNIYDQIQHCLQEFMTPISSDLLTSMSEEGIPCQGYWIEDSRELVVCLWVGDQMRSVIVPPEEWKVRRDITLH